MRREGEFGIRDGINALSVGKECSGPGTRELAGSHSTSLRQGLGLPVVSSPMKLYRAQSQGPCGLLVSIRFFCGAAAQSSALEILVKIPSVSAATNSFLPRSRIGRSTESREFTTAVAATWRFETKESARSTVIEGGEATGRVPAGSATVILLQSRHDASSRQADLGICTAEQCQYLSPCLRSSRQSPYRRGGPSMISRE